MTKTQILTEITDFNGICNSKIMRVRNYWLKKPVWTGLNQFVQTCQKLLIDKKRGGQAKL